LSPYDDEHVPECLSRELRSDRNPKAGRRGRSGDGARDFSWPKKRDDQIFVHRQNKERCPDLVEHRDGAVPVLQASRDQYPPIEKVFADSVYAGERVANATSIVVEIVRKLPHQVGFQVLPRRWMIERFFAWINRNPRLAKDFEGTIASAKAFLRAACVMLLTRRLARSA
jgi:transposase